MEFAKVNVDVRAARREGRRAQGPQPRARSPACSTAASASRSPSTFDEKELLSSLDKEKRRNTVLKLTVRDGGQVRRGDGDGARRADQPAVAASSCTSTSCGRPERRGARDGSARAHRQGRSASTNGGNLHQSMHLVPDRGEAGGDPDQARGRRLGAGHRRRAPRQRPEAGRRRARRCSTPRRPSPRSSRRRPRRSKRSRRLPSRARSRPKARRLAQRRAQRPARPRRGSPGCRRQGSKGRRQEEARREDRPSQRLLLSRDSGASRCTWWSGWATRASSTQDNRHNVGFMVVGRARAARPGLRAAREVRRASCRRSTIAGEARAAVQAAWSS